ncbi:hypothetical protein GGI25_002026 [Coemansia spiralis]|uniref:Uncharacterized protein n=1 Tax=Coemansia spiralis TaxID=417178 RepID=A0A9W8KYX3_9FUNG|nr:hypothetical protein GGI25_002026 [Coemansia spiralis]
MRFITITAAFALVSFVAAAPHYAGDVTQVIGLPVITPPVIPYPIGSYPSSGSGNSGSGSGSGSGGSGSGNSGSNGGNGSSGNGSNGSGSNGSGSGGSGSNGSGSSGSGPSGGAVGNAKDCGLSPGQVSALTPLVDELQLTRTVDDLKHLTKQITDLLADTLQESAVSSILNIVDSLVAGLGLGGLDLKPAVDGVTSILRKQVPCLLDTLLPKP